MPAPPVKNSKTAPVSAPVPEVPAQKGGKKVAPAPAVVAAPAASAVVAAPVQKGAAAKKVAAPAPAPAPVPVPVPVPAPVQKGGKKVAPVAKAVKVAPAQKASAPKAKKAAVPKAPKAPKAKKGEDDEEGEDDAKGVRSFKVQLPGTEDYSGRFTGLTPYQAANKALSKYFRENKTAKSEISFSIRESTRGSKRSTYTYNGKREKLAVPVKYSIKSADGAVREIVKEYKNKLTKVKKSETKEVVA